MALREKIARLRSSDRASMWVSILLGLVFGALFIFTLLYFFGESRKATSSIIFEHTQKLRDILQTIDKDCTILGFDLEKNYINFLNVKGFLGSEIGSMNLGHPKNWKGPYVTENFTIQGIPYYILKANKGYYIVPGDGVILSDGKILGRDIAINSTTDIETLTKVEKGLSYQEKPLIVKIELNKATQITPEITAEAYGAYLAE